MGPGLFSDIGKRARDLLYTEYSTDQKLTLLGTSENLGGMILASKQKKVLGEIHSHIKYKNSLCDIRMKSDSTLVATFTLNEVMPVLRSIFSLLDQRSGKVEIQYAHKYIGLSATTGLKTIPVSLNQNVASLVMSAVFGTAAMSIGADVGYDATRNNVTNYLGVCMSTSERIASLTLRNQEDLAATYFQLVSPATAVAAELFHHFPGHTNAVVFGVQHAIHPDTTVKARINTSGMATVMFQHFWPHTLIPVSAETNLLANDSSGRVGLDLTLIA